MSLQNEKQPRLYDRRKVRGLLWLGLCALSIAAGAASYFSLQTRVDELKTRQTELEKQRDAVVVEVDRMKRMLEYSKMDEYAISVAHERLGLVGKDELKFVQPEAGNGD